MINDEANELMVTQGVPFDRFYFMAPERSYPSGTVSPMEMGPLYVHRLLFWLFRDYFENRDQYLLPLHGLSVLVLAGACVAFFYALREYVSRPQAFAGALALAMSYTPLLLNQFISRFRVTIIWGCLLMIFVPRLLDASNRSTSQNLKNALICAGLALGGAWTYTTYLIASVAIWTGMGIAWLRFKRDWKTLGWIFASGATFAVLLLGFYATDTFSFQGILFRGGYAVAEAAAYPQNAVLSLCSPLIYRASGNFFLEDVHVIFNRSGVAAALGPFFALGFLVAWFTRTPALLAAIVTWLVGALLCAMSGPNQKYLYTFFTLVLLLSLYGVRLVFTVLHDVGGRRVASGFVIFVALLTFGQDLRDLRNQPVDAGRETMNILPSRVAQESMTLAAAGVDTFVQVGTGYDLLNWYLWPESLGMKVKRCPVAEGLPELFRRSPPAAGAVLLVDYPPDTLPKTLPGWIPPAELTIKMVSRDFAKAK